MKIGVRAHDFGRRSAAELADAIAGLGFNAAQLAVQKAITGIESYLTIGAEDRERIAAAFTAAGIEISVLGCYIEPALLHRDQRLAQLEPFYAALRSAAAFGAGCVGTETTRFEGGRGEREAAYVALLDSALRMAEEAERVGAYFAIEPVRGHTLDSPELTARLLREVASPRLRIIFDPVNLLDIDLVEKQDSLWRECMEAFAPKICALHVKDRRIEGGALAPCGLGRGVTDWAVLREGLREHGIRVPLLREEGGQATAAEDRLFLEGLAAGMENRSAD